MIIKIVNNVSYHYEILPSVIERYDKILKLDKKGNDDIILLDVVYDKSFMEYIERNYGNRVNIVSSLTSLSEHEPERLDVDYVINCTFYDRYVEMNNLGIYLEGDGSSSMYILGDMRSYYICHDVSERLRSCMNVYFMFPFGGIDMCPRYFVADVFPYSHLSFGSGIGSGVKVFVVQGNICESRRKYYLLRLVLDGIECGYRIRVLGRLRKGRVLPEYLLGDDRVELCLNYDYDAYHRAFIGCDYIIPLVNREDYYNGKLSSSVNYGIGYGLCFLVDRRLSDVYGLGRYNSVLYDGDDDNDFLCAFRRCLL